jgi:CBS domain-containing protein
MQFDDFNPDEEEADLNHNYQSQIIPRRTTPTNAPTSFATTIPTLNTTNLNTVNQPKLSARHLPLQIDEELLKPIVSFYKNQTNYDCMPTSCKVMVFDIDLPIREAFTIAARNGMCNLISLICIDISFATLWDSTKSSLVGMLTVTDLIDLLLHYHDQTNVIQEIISQKRIREWRGTNYYLKANNCRNANTFTTREIM